MIFWMSSLYILKFGMFCSQKYKSDNKKGKLGHEEDMDVDVESLGPESSLSPSEAALHPNENEDDNANKVDPLKWTVSLFSSNNLNN